MQSSVWKYYFREGENRGMFTSSKKELIFFDLFSNAMDDTFEAATRFQKLITGYTDIEAKVSGIEALEHKCDVDIHTILEHLNRSFITPIDREDIYIVAKELDNITDHIESAAHCFTLFEIKEVKPAAEDLVDVIVQTAHELQIVFQEFKHMKTSTILHDKIVEVNRLENQGDEVFRTTIHNLFLQEKDPISLIKWKEIYEYMENAIDACENVANIIEGIVMKNA